MNFGHGGPIFTALIDLSLIPRTNTALVPIYLFSRVNPFLDKANKLSYRLAFSYYCMTTAASILFGYLRAVRGVFRRSPTTGRNAYRSESSARSSTHYFSLLSSFLAWTAGGSVFPPTLDTAGFAFDRIYNHVLLCLAFRLNLPDGPLCGCYTCESVVKIGAGRTRTCMANTRCHVWHPLVRYRLIASSLPPLPRI